MSSRSRTGALSVVAVLSTALVVPVLAGPASAAPTRTTVVVSPDDEADFAAVAFDNDSDLEPNQAFVAGPGRPPLGVGSRRLTIGEDANRVEQYRTPQYDGVRLADLTELAYATYAESNGDDLQQPAYLRLTVDADANGTRDAGLFFIPANNASQGAVANDVWQSWDTVAEGAVFNVDGDGGATTTLAGYVAENPDAVLLNNAEGTPEGGAVALIVGASGNNQRNADFFVDALTVGEGETITTFDFEPTVDERIVSDLDLMGWKQVSFDAATDADLVTTQAFVAGPATPPAGDGSRKLAIDDNVNRVEQFRTGELDDTLLSQIDLLGYSTYVGTSPSGTQQQPVYLRLTLSNGDSLFFLPANNADQGAVESDVWQSWNVTGGDVNVNGDGGPGSTVSFAAYAGDNPGVTIVGNSTGGGLALLAGASGDNQRNVELFADRVVVGANDEDVQLFDFEQASAPAFTGSLADSATVGTAYTSTAGTTATPTATITLEGTLPDGLSFTDNGDGTFTVSGTPTTTGASTFTLVATNANGEARQTETITVAAPTGQPGAVRNLTAVQTGPGQVTVTWDAPADQGASPITGYGIGISQGESGNGREVPAGQRSVVFDNVAPGTYTISVVAINSQGAGPATRQTVTVVTPFPATPAPSPSSPAPTTSPSPTPTATPGPAACTVPSTVTLERTTITATGSSGVTVRTSPNSVVDLYAYTRPSTAYRVVRSAEVNSSGVTEFRVTPPANTRLYAQQRGCAAGESVVLNVRTALSLFARRNGVRNYTFSGDSLPARAGGLIVSLYRVTAEGRQVLAAQTRASATTGDWVINRRFTGSGRFGFVVRTGQDLQNAPGVSNVRPTLVF